MRQPVGQRLDGALHLLGAAVEPGEEPGPAGKPLGEFLDPVVLGRGRVRIRLGLRRLRVAGRLAQRRDQRRRRALGEHLRLDAQRRGQRQQRLARDSAAVVLDQVEIGGRDPGLPRQVRLPDAGHDPPFADARADRHRVRHRVFHASGWACRTCERHFLQLPRARSRYFYKSDCCCQAACCEIFRLFRILSRYG
jgi:hypothetical protein